MKLLDYSYIQLKIYLQFEDISFPLRLINFRGDTFAFAYFQISQIHCLIAKKKVNRIYLRKPMGFPTHKPLASLALGRVKRTD